MDGLHIPSQRRWEPKLLYPRKPDPSSLARDFAAIQHDVVPKDVLRGTPAAHTSAVIRPFDFQLLFEEINAGLSKKGDADNDLDDPQSLCPVCHGIIEKSDPPESVPCPYPDEAMRDSRYKAGQNHCPVCLGWLVSSNDARNASPPSPGRTSKYTDPPRSRNMALTPPRACSSS
jgi:hypothetical protein